jgi:UDP-glucose 4-epimerase
MIKNARILVTGGAGFIGSNIADRLCSDNKVTVLDNLSSGALANLEKSKARLTFVEGDVLDKSAVEKLVAEVEFVFHLAANVGNIKSIEDPRFDMEVNIKGTLNILEACLKYKIKKLVYSSSAAIYGDAQYLPVDEGHPLNPESPYAVSKLAAEKYCFAFHKVHGLPVVALRYFNVYGPKQGSSQYANVIPIFFRKIRDGEPLTIFGDGKQTRDFVNVKDVVAANMLAAESKETFGVFNIASGKSTTVNEVADHAISIMKSKTERIYAPSRKGEVLHSLADISKAKKTLGFKPTVSIAEGLRQYGEYLKAH